MTLPHGHRAKAVVAEDQQGLHQSLFVSSLSSLCWVPSSLISTRPPEALWCSSPGCTFLKKMLSASWTFIIFWSFDLRNARLQISTQLIIPPQTQGLLITWAVSRQVTVKRMFLQHMTSLPPLHLLFLHVLQNQLVKMDPCPTAQANLPGMKPSPSRLPFYLHRKDSCRRFWLTMQPSNRSGLHQPCLNAVCVLWVTLAQTAWSYPSAVISSAGPASLSSARSRSQRGMFAALLVLRETALPLQHLRRYSPLPGQWSS